jgi:hypothetical protein
MKRSREHKVLVRYNGGALERQDRPPGLHCLISYFYLHSRVSLLQQDKRRLFPYPIPFLSNTPGFSDQFAFEQEKHLPSHLQNVVRVDRLQLHFIQEHFTISLSAMMFLALGLVFFLALGFMFFIQLFSADRPLSSIWEQTFHRTLCKPRKPVPDTEIKLSQDVKPYQFPPLRERTSTKMAMGLKRLDESNWLTLDSNYLPEHFLRCSLLCAKHTQVIQCLPGAEAACHEVLSLVTSFLSSRFPQHFTITTLSSGPAIHNHLTNEIFPIGQQNCPDPLEVAAKLSMEDFNILMKQPETGEYHLQASATLFPAGWKLQERVGTSMANLHQPVPGWKEKLGGSVNRYDLLPKFMLGWLTDEQQIL